METKPEFTEALTNLKLLLKRSDLIEVKPPRYNDDLGRRRDVRYGDYFHDKFGGKATKLKRYLQKLLQYSAQVANDELTRADIIADGPGLSDTCLGHLENASRVPLPGFADTYEETTLAQKQRVLDLLLTYVYLFYQEEPNVALNDLRLEGPMLTGLLDMYHQLNRGSMTLPTKLIEECLARGILRATNGQGTALIGNFQGQLRFHKRMEPGWEKDEAKHRRLLFNCCSELTAEAKSVPIPSILSTNTANTPFRGGGSMSGKRENRTEHSVNEAQVSWDDEYELYEEYAALAMTTSRTDSKPKYEDKGRYEGRDRQKTYGNKEGQSKGSKEAYMSRVFCTAPCACCGSDKHAMLSPIRAPDGTPQTTEYTCPVALCDNWNEAKNTKPIKLRFAPCPKKFAAAYKNDTNLATAALKDYAEQGSGKFRDPAERTTFTNEVLKACKPANKTAGGTRLVGSVDKELRCNSGQIEYTGEHDCFSVTVDGEDNEIISKYCESDKSINSERYIDEESKDVFDGCTIIETYNANGVTKAPSPLTHSSLHLLVASKVEPPSRTEVQQFIEQNFESTISRSFDEYNDEEDKGCWVLMEMTYGAEYIVPYKLVHGRILADTGSTTTLINESFAVRQGLEMRSTGSGQIILRDVNDGTSQLTKQCFLRLTITTVEGELISFIILAFCTDKLKHDILLGTRDLERYKIDVSSHRGEAKMELPDGVVAFPMLDSAQITHLQKLALGNNDQC
jgi:hypothetical protein